MLQKQLEKIVANSDDDKIPDKYWQQESQFKSELKDHLRVELFISELSKRQIFIVLEWCSRYRPVEPHVALSLFGRLAK